MGERTLQDLKMKQALPLDAKVLLTKSRIREWVNHYGVDGVYVSFSGGKDSTVLLHLVREMYPNVEAVFVDTGLEYPEIREFVRSFDNVTWLKPKINFKKVIETYGYPFISKEVSNNVDGARKYLTAKSEIEILDRQTDRQTDRQSGTFRIPTTTEEYAEFANMLNNDWGKTKGSPQRLAIMLGMLTPKGMVDIPNKDRSKFSMERYSFLLNADFNISDKCCAIMKKSPAHEYFKTSKKTPIIATMASESRLRTQKWMQNGCNGFKMKIPTSTPMSFWTEQDVLMYIKLNNIPIASVYGDIVAAEKDELAGQETWSTLGIFDTGMPTLKTTGCQRTGCMFCGYGCHLEKGKGRFELMKETHPKQYEWIMKPWSEGGLGYKEVIDWLNENGNLNIKY